MHYIAPYRSQFRPYNRAYAYRGLTAFASLSLAVSVRTIRPGLAPSELVVATALRHSLPEFLLSYAHNHTFAKFIIDREDPDRLEVFRLAS